MAKLLDKVIIATVSMKIKMVADFSFWTALKLRLAGGKFIEEYIKKILDKGNDD